MKIWLFELAHATSGMHTNAVPLGIGQIKRYLEKTVKEPLEIKLFKDINKVLNEKNYPDLLGIALYAWNNEINLHFAKLIKSRNPECLVIAGGPNLDKDKNKKIAFLKNNPFIDLCIAYEGEISVKEIVDRKLKGESNTSIRDNPAAGSFSFTNHLNESKDIPKRITDLSIFGTMYAEGFFDEFLDEDYAPIIQIQRGCPFSCAFCGMSDPYFSKMIFMPKEIFQIEIEYLAKRFMNLSNVTLHLACTNMSMFREDFEIAKILHDMQDKYKWPRFIYAYYGKDPDKQLEMQTIFNFTPNIALQTLTPEVLSNIGRINIPIEKFTKFQNEVLRRTKELQTTELIVCLPGETKESFLKTIMTVIDSGVQGIDVYTLMKLKGTKLASEEFEKKYKYISRFRVIPRQFSEINGERIIEIEEVIVGTNTMALQDYLDLRGLSFTIFAFISSIELIPLRRLLLEHNLKISDWIFAAHERMQHDFRLQGIYSSFIKEANEELFTSRESLLRFYENNENFEDLKSGKSGDNLFRKFKYLLLSKHFEDYLDVSLEVAKEIAEKKELYEVNQMLDDMKKYLKMRDLGPLLENKSVRCNQVIDFGYDIPKWVESSEKKPLGDYKNKCKYEVKVNTKAIYELDKYRNMNKNTDLALQVIFRDGGTRDLWPEWKKVGN